MARTSKIRDYEIDRLEVPAGRTIGDNGCAYDSFDLVVVRLKTRCGLVGWGYGDCVWKGWFNRPAWWIRPGASLEDLQRSFATHWWPHLEERRPFETRLVRRSHHSDQNWLDNAVRMALWDLMAKQVDLPLYKMLGGHTHRIKAYGSPLDYPLDEAQAVVLAQSFVERGCKAIKVKIGAPGVERDIQRLRAIRKAIGDDIELTADANLAWDADTTIERLNAFEQAGLRLEYLEDPIPHDHLEEYAALKGCVGVDIVAHDYIATPREMALLLQTGAIKRVRPGADLDLILDIADLAKHFNAPMIFGNSLFEMNIHAACALPDVDRLEFSDLAWNQLVVQPVRFKDGYGYAPQSPGHGLELRDEALTEYRQHKATTMHEQVIPAE